MAKDFVGTIENYYVKENGTVLLSVKNANGLEPNCNTSSNELWPFYFIIDNEAKSKMFDMLINEANNQQTIYVGHEENDVARCKVLYLAVIKG
jgi:hypothetical protein